MANLEITHVRLSPGGKRHEHIIQVQGPGFGIKDRFEAVSDIYYGRNSYFTRPVGNALSLLTIANGGGTKVERRAAGAFQSLSPNDYLQTIANGVWDDNLLALPRF